MHASTVPTTYVCKEVEKDLPVLLICCIPAHEYVGLVDDNQCVSLGRFLVVV